MKKILLHSCCAPCSAYVIQELQKEYKVTLFYFNPNIFPKEEYQKRLAEAKEYCQKIKVDFIEAEYDHGLWLEKLRVMKMNRKEEKDVRFIISFV